MADKKDANVYGFRIDEVNERYQEGRDKMKDLLEGLLKDFSGLANDYFQKVDKTLVEMLQDGIALHMEGGLPEKKEDEQPEGEVIEPEEVAEKKPAKSK